MKKIYISLFAFISALAFSVPALAQTFEFQYGGKPLADNATVTISAVEDIWGMNTLNCETNPKEKPLDGLTVVMADGSNKPGKAKLEVLSNTLNPASLQWCMGGECVVMKTNTLEKDFSTNYLGKTLVMFDAVNVSAEGSLDAKLTATIGAETHVVNIKFNNGGTASVAGVTVDKQQPSAWYTIGGVRLAAPPTSKGVYIVNGKKIVR